MLDHFLPPSYSSRFRGAFNEEGIQGHLLTLFGGSGGLSGALNEGVIQGHLLTLLGGHSELGSKVMGKTFFWVL